jgi:hypothetical protein
MALLRVIVWGRLDTGLGESVVNYLLFQPALSGALALGSFVVMIWPGYALLHLFGFGRHRCPLAEFVCGGTASPRRFPL